MKRLIRHYVWLVLALVIQSVFSSGPLVWERPVSNIAFGSCNRHTGDQKIYKSILESDPDVYVWLGDAVYADESNLPFYWYSTTADEMRLKFDTQKVNPHYSDLIKRVPIVGIWDDHDYGKNNGGREFELREKSAKIYLDFIGEPEDSPRRHQKNGIYTSYDLPGAYSHYDIKLILLDVRYNKPENFGDEDMLGAEQWAWLEDQLANSLAKIHIIGSGIQFSPDAKVIQENWGNNNINRLQLMRLLKKHKTPGVFFLSGDVHYSEVMKLPAACTGIGYDIFEFTSSGLTHTCNEALFGHCEWVLERVFKTQYHFEGSFFTGRNWGSLNIDWERRSIQLQTHNATGHIVFHHNIPFDTLKFNPEMVTETGLEACDRVKHFYHNLTYHNWKAILLITLAFTTLLALLVPLFVLKKLYRFKNKPSQTIKTMKPCGGVTHKKIY